MHTSVFRVCDFAHRKIPNCLGVFAPNCTWAILRRDIFALTLILSYKKYAGSSENPRNQLMNWETVKLCELTFSVPCWISDENPVNGRTEINKFNGRHVIDARISTPWENLEMSPIKHDSHFCSFITVTWISNCRFCTIFLLFFFSQFETRPSVNATEKKNTHRSKISQVWWNTYITA